MRTLTRVEKTYLLNASGMAEFALGHPQWWGKCKVDKRSRPQERQVHPTALRLQVTRNPAPRIRCVPMVLLKWEATLHTKYEFGARRYALISMMEVRQYSVSI